MTNFWEICITFMKLIQGYCHLGCKQMRLSETFKLEYAYKDVTSIKKLVHTKSQLIQWTARFCKSCVKSNLIHFY